MDIRVNRLRSQITKSIFVCALVLFVSAPSYASTAKLNNVPAFDWSYGCSPTAAAMMMGYYDRIGYANMYTGQTDGGICPLTNAIWGTGECPISATHICIDGRTTNGHVEDYWVTYDSTAADPYITKGETPHASDCLADFMGTSQSAYGNDDGSSMYFYNQNGYPINDYTGSEPGSRDMCHGLKLYAEYCGYQVLSNYSQTIAGYNNVSRGFSFDNYVTEINAGRPVIIQLSGHTILGYGYDTAGNTVYVHDTWDYSEHTMVWGGSYSGMQQTAVTIFRLASAPAPVPEPAGLLVFANGALVFAGILIRRRVIVN